MRSPAPIAACSETGVTATPYAVYASTEKLETCCSISSEQAAARNAARAKLAASSSSPLTAAGSHAKAAAGQPSGGVDARSGGGWLQGGGGEAAVLPRCSRSNGMRGDVRALPPPPLAGAGAPLSLLSARLRNSRDASDSAAQPRIAAAAGLSDFARRPRLPLSEAASPPPPPLPTPPPTLAPLAPLPLAALASCDEATGRASKRTVIASPENETTSPPCLWKQRIRSEK
mmetsp:Transcript_44527/g.140248  ORF Transcript_44527/g.140248 Transcript_44527/m.140248 type:complete len:230 (+) Transcript_44527:784-1473(+)